MDCFEVKDPKFLTESIRQDNEATSNRISNCFYKLFYSDFEKFAHSHLRGRHLSRSKERELAHDAFADGLLQFYSHIKNKGFENKGATVKTLLFTFCIYKLRGMITSLKRQSEKQSYLPHDEILKGTDEEIFNYFEELEKQGTEYLYEAKMLIVGQPSAGKTSLRYKLSDINSPLPEADKTTRGIDIDRLSFDITDKAGRLLKFYYNVWDFGGQQIYQTTHQFFLTNRSLYVLVMDTGKDSIGNDDTILNYWLQVVELLGGDSPLILVRNEKNGRQVNVDLSPKKERFNFLKHTFSLDLNALIPGSFSYSEKRVRQFNILKKNIETELECLEMVGFPMPTNWAQIRNELQRVSKRQPYISRQEYFDLCKSFDVVEYKRQMALSRIFHDLGIFLHFQDFNALEELIILQNTWATDAVFAVLDNLLVRDNHGQFNDNDLAGIWEPKGYEPAVHKKLLALMMQFELCYQVNKSKPAVYIVPEMLPDSQPHDYKWRPNDDLPLQYWYDFMPKGILTRFIVRLHVHIRNLKDNDLVWKTGVVIDGNSLDCPNTVAEVTEAWDNKKLFIKVQGLFSKELMSKVTLELDLLNEEYFKQLRDTKQSQKSKWYKMIPCNCPSCSGNNNKHFYNYGKLLERKEFGKDTIECEKPPFHAVTISELLEGVFAKQKNEEEAQLSGKTIKIFLASSEELKKDRKQFEIFINRENKILNKNGVFLELNMWEDSIDAMSKTRLQDLLNKAARECDIFISLFFTKVGKYTAEEFENAFSQFKMKGKPVIYTYFKDDKKRVAQIKKEDINSKFDFEEKLKYLGHFITIYKTVDDLKYQFKRQLEKILS